MAAPFWFLVFKGLLSCHDYRYLQESGWFSPFLNQEPRGGKEIERAGDMRKCLCF